MKDISEMLDLLETALVSNIKQIIKQVGKEITDQEAKNILAKIGTRIMFSDSLGKKEVDNILAK